MSPTETKKSYFLNSPGAIFKEEASMISINSIENLMCVKKQRFSMSRNSGSQNLEIYLIWFLNKRDKIRSVVVLRRDKKHTKYLNKYSRGLLE